MSDEQGTEHNPEQCNNSSEFPMSSGPACCCAKGKWRWVIAAIIGIMIIVLAKDVFYGGNSGPTIPWRKDYAQAMADAKSQDKPILLAFSTRWCSWCRKMKKKTYPDPEVMKTAAAFVPIMINPDKSGDLKKQYRTKGYPTHIILSPDGKRIATIEGYLKADEFLEILNDALKQIDAN